MKRALCTHGKKSVIAWIGIPFLWDSKCETSNLLFTMSCLKSRATVPLISSSSIFSRYALSFNFFLSSLPPFFPPPPPDLPPLLFCLLLLGKAFGILSVIQKVFQFYSVEKAHMLFCIGTMAFKCYHFYFANLPPPKA